jgi:hypothetical protein
MPFLDAWFEESRRSGEPCYSATEVSSMSAPPSARWNIVSVATPFVGLLCGVVVYAQSDGHPLFGPGIARGVIVWTLFCVFGLLAAGVSRARAERWQGITTAGFVLNAILPAFLLCSGAFFLMSWLRSG